jgi:hypothetical protein
MSWYLPHAYRTQALRLADDFLAHIFSASFRFLGTVAGKPQFHRANGLTGDSVVIALT